MQGIPMFSRDFCPFIRLMDGSNHEAFFFVDQLITLLYCPATMSPPRKANGPERRYVPPRHRAPTASCITANPPHCSPKAPAAPPPSWQEPPYEDQPRRRVQARTAPRISCSSQVQALPPRRHRLTRFHFLDILLIIRSFCSQRARATRLG